MLRNLMQSVTDPVARCIGHAGWVWVYWGTGAVRVSTADQVGGLVSPPSSCERVGLGALRGALHVFLFVGMSSRLWASWGSCVIPSLAGASRRLSFLLWA